MSTRRSEAPEVTSVVGDDVLHSPDAVQVQFRYAFVCDEEGVKVLDVTDLAQPAAGRRSCRWPNAHNIYLARTYAYVAAGQQGLVILDIDEPGAARRSIRSSTPAAASTTCTT